MHRGIGSPDVSIAFCVRMNRFTTNGSTFEKILSRRAWSKIGKIGLTKSVSTTPNSKANRLSCDSFRWQAERLPYNARISAQSVSHIQK